LIEQFTKRTLLIVSVLVMTACASIGTNYHDYGFQLAQQAGFKTALIKTEVFDLTAFVRIENHHQPIHFYIEGDGFAWVNRSQLSSDPTPHQPIGLKLATKDTHANVVYLARPCQYQRNNRFCSSDYWSTKRFSVEVIRAMNNAVNQLNEFNQPVELIGYSGGAAIAVLLASQRTDVSSLRTVAGNLDHRYVNRLHHVDEMPESLNPIDVATKVSSVPQLHFVGSDDKVIPVEVGTNFIAKLGDRRCARLVEIKARHQDDWEVQWSRLVRMPLTCAD
jgi:hypothetical protein